MLSIRLKRFGKKKAPTYRLVVMDSRLHPSSEHKEALGFYNPCAKTKKIEFKNDRIQYWLGVGAKPSPTVHNLFVDAGLLKAPKMKVAIKKKAKAEAEQKAEPTAEKPAEKTA